MLLKLLDTLITTNIKQYTTSGFRPRNQTANSQPSFTFFFYATETRGTRQPTKAKFTIGLWRRHYRSSRRWTSECKINGEKRTREWQGERESERESKMWESTQTPAWLVHRWITKKKTCWTGAVIVHLGIGTVRKSRNKTEMKMEANERKPKLIANRMNNNYTQLSKSQIYKFKWKYK